MKKLDWTRLLGFEQVAKDRETVGKRIGGKVGAKAGTKTMARLGSKVGGKG